MLMIGLIVGVRMRVPCPVRMHVLVLVKDDLQTAPEGVGDAAQRDEVRDVIASFQARDHGFGHGKPLGELLLRLAGVLAKFEQAMGALSGDGGAVVERRSIPGMSDGLLHGANLARLRSLVLSKLAKFESIRM